MATHTTLKKVARKRPAAQQAPPENACQKGRLVCCSVYGNSHKPISGVAELYLRTGMRITDVTYGEGVFWRPAVRPPYLVACRGPPTETGFCRHIFQ